MIDVNKFFKLLDNSQYFDINNFILEYVSYHSDKLTQETGALVRQFMVIDAGGIGLAHVSLRMFIRFKPIMPLADLYYPELLGGARVLNAAWALHQGWKLVKPLLSKQIQAPSAPSEDLPPTRPLALSPSRPLAPRGSPL